MSWMDILKHQPRNKEGDRISVKQEHINTITEWLENNEGHEMYDVVKHMFDRWEKVDFTKGREYNLILLFARDGELFNLYR